MEIGGGNFLSRVEETGVQGDWEDRYNVKLGETCEEEGRTQQQQQGGGGRPVFLG